MFSGADCADEVNSSRIAAEKFVPQNNFNQRDTRGELFQLSPTLDNAVSPQGVFVKDITESTPFRLMRENSPKI